MLMTRVIPDLSNSPPGDLLSDGKLHFFLC